MADQSDRVAGAALDVAAILEALRAEVRARRLAQGTSADSPLRRDLQRALDEIELHRVVSAHWPLTATTLPGRAVNLINKLVRRYLRWYINPIVEQQNSYNDAVARALRLLADAYADLGEQIAGLATSDERGGETSKERRATRDDVESLMTLVRERAQDEPPARFADLELRALEPQLRLRERVSAHWPLGGATLPQRAVTLVNKLVRDMDGRIGHERDEAGGWTHFRVHLPMAK